MAKAKYGEWAHLANMAQHAPKGAPLPVYWSMINNQDMGFEQAMDDHIKTLGILDDPLAGYEGGTEEQRFMSDQPDDPMVPGEFPEYTYDGDWWDADEFFIPEEGTALQNTFDAIEEGNLDEGLNNVEEILLTTIPTYSMALDPPFPDSIPEDMDGGIEQAQPIVQNPSMDRLGNMVGWFGDVIGGVGDFAGDILQGMGETELQRQEALGMPGLPPRPPTVREIVPGEDIGGGADEYPWIPEDEEEINRLGLLGDIPWLFGDATEHLIGRFGGTDIGQAIRGTDTAQAIVNKITGIPSALGDIGEALSNVPISSSNEFYDWAGDMASQVPGHVVEQIGNIVGNSLNFDMIEEVLGPDWTSGNISVLPTWGPSTDEEDPTGIMGDPLGIGGEPTSISQTLGLTEAKKQGVEERAEADRLIKTAIANGEWEQLTESMTVAQFNAWLDQQGMTSAGRSQNLAKFNEALVTKKPTVPAPGTPGATPPTVPAPGTPRPIPPDALTSAIEKGPPPDQQPYDIAKENLGARFYKMIYGMPGAGYASQNELSALGNQTRLLFFLEQGERAWDNVKEKDYPALEENYQTYLGEYLKRPFAQRLDPTEGQGFYDLVKDVGRIFEMSREMPDIEGKDAAYWTDSDKNKKLWVDGLFGGDTTYERNDRDTLVKMAITHGGMGYYSSKIHAAAQRQMDYYRQIGWNEAKIFKRMTEGIKKPRTSIAPIPPRGDENQWGIDFDTQEG